MSLGSLTLHTQASVREDTSLDVFQRMSQKVIDPRKEKKGKGKQNCKGKPREKNSLDSLNSGSHVHVCVRARAHTHTHTHTHMRTGLFPALFLPPLNFHVPWLIPVKVQIHFIIVWGLQKEKPRRQNQTSRSKWGSGDLVLFGLLGVFCHGWACHFRLQGP